MIEFLVVVIVALAYALGRTQDERDRLRLRMSELWSGSWSPRAHWQPVEERLAAERAIWRQTAAVQRAARQAMRDVVARVAEDEESGAPVATPTDPTLEPAAARQARPEVEDNEWRPQGADALNLGWLYSLYAWAIGFLVAVCVALGVIAALGQYVPALGAILILLIVLRVVWWHTRW